MKSAKKFGIFKEYVKIIAKNQEILDNHQMIFLPITEML